MRVHKLAFAALAVTAALSLTACQDDTAGSAQGAPTTAPAATTGGSPSGGPASGAPAPGAPAPGAQA
ncbi:DUF4232 domain-containing protein, partial [Kitasatospora sp. NPDC047058]